MDRRTFLKMAGMGSVAFAGGCNPDAEKKLFTLVQAPDDMVTGQATWYASTCRECPAGCGVLAKNREGRVIKLEGNPLHPVNQGKLCLRGQAALQGLYNPDRIQKPRLKANNRWETIGYDKALAVIAQQLSAAAAKGSGQVAMLTEVVGNALLNQFTEVLTRNGGDAPLVFEPFAYESLKFAHTQVFGRPILPSYRMDQADLLLSLGADFLETWLSPVEYARKFKAMHVLMEDGKGMFLHVSPYQSLTAANADHWLTCTPGSETAVALALIQRALNRGRGRRLPTPLRASLNHLTGPYSLAKTADLTGISISALEMLIHRVMTARRPLVLGGGTAAHGPSTAATDLAVALLNALLDPAFSLYDFDQRHRVEIAGPRAAIMAFWEKMTRSPAHLLLLNNVNPLYTLPADSPVAEVLSGKQTFVVAFNNFMDETAAMADLIIPVQMALESWDIYESKQSMKATLQPAMGRITSAPNIGDLFLQLLPAAHRPAADYKQYLVQQTSEQNSIASDAEWLRMVQSGGQFVAGRRANRLSLDLNGKQAAVLSELLDKVPAADPDKPTLYLIPSLRYFDGRGANRPWLSETPDSLTQVAWQSLAWVHPRTMAAKGWSEGEIIRVTTAHGDLKVPVYKHAGMHPSAVVIPMGQGHKQYGRYARNQGVNPVQLMGVAVEPQVGAPNYALAVRKIAGAGSTKLASTSGSRVQHDRNIALSVALESAHTPDQSQGLGMNDFPLALPLPEGYDHRRDVYPPHDHNTYRWGMVVDLDRCIGCSACVGACYAENNIGVVGEERIIQGREMAWIRIERYEDPRDPTRLIFLPMMCQHCDNAPCESVCPVYAPHHSKEGINNQVYNRCIGTRFCAQNCPYKVRRFNWFDWSWPKPLDMQLNPNVTVRSKGVMEKCSFCIQRIKTAHGEAKNQKRTIRDGEVIPACVQTCPTDALYFGNLMDKNSTVRKLMDDPRAYQVMGYLNTKPAVVYLRKVVQSL